MCGIGGIISSEALPSNVLDNALRSLSLRGPDGSGTWLSPDQKIGILHTRLSILDLSLNASQPMESDNRRYVISFNGEIYNYKELKYQNTFTSAFKSTGDTELLLKLIEKKGIHEALKLTDGMFSIAILDQLKKKIYLARDRFGEKPLYYYFDNKNFIFGSDIKSILKNNYFKNELNFQSIKQYLANGYFPKNESIFMNTHQVQPGNILEFNILNKKITNHSFWSPYQEIYKYRDTSHSLEFNQENLEELIENSVKSRLVADVPIGCFLSSGTDSSLITAIASKFALSKIDTFTIGFQEKNWDESKNAKKISRHIGTNHNELIINSSTILDSVVDTIDLYDQPFSDPSAIPTNILSKFTSQKVKVVLSGDGGDELFSGYERYRQIQKILRTPRIIKLLISKILSFNKNYLKIYNLNTDKFMKLDNILKQDSLGDMYKHFNYNPSNFNDSFYDELNLNTNSENQSEYLNFGSAGWMQLNDICNYLPGNILVKVDRASMHHSLDTRAPFLNPELVNFSFNALKNDKNYFYNKEPLKNILSKYIPRELAFSQKKGFSVPIVSWLRGPLKDWAEDLILLSSRSDLDIIDHSHISTMWKEHKQETRNWHNQLWTYLVLIQWLSNKEFI